jgi:hypothetical protein
MPYVVTEPKSVRGVYTTWEECQAATGDAAGSRQMRVETQEEGEAILAGGVILDTGWYAFTDGNALGGVGVVLVRMADGEDEPEVVNEIAASVKEVLGEAAIPGLESDLEVDESLDRLANILAEMAGLYAAINASPDGSRVTIVHDYMGVGAFMRKEWRARNSIVDAVGSVSRSLAERKGLQLRFQHQASHRSSHARRHDFARFNGRADELAAEGAAERLIDRRP